MLIFEFVDPLPPVSNSVRSLMIFLTRSESARIKGLFGKRFLARDMGQAKNNTDDERRSRIRSDVQGWAALKSAGLESAIWPRTRSERYTKGNKINSYAVLSVSKGISIVANNAPSPSVVEAVAGAWSRSRSVTVIVIVIVAATVNSRMVKGGGGDHGLACRRPASHYHTHTMPLTSYRFQLQLIIPKRNTETNEISFYLTSPSSGPAVLRRPTLRSASSYRTAHTSSTSKIVTSVGSGGPSAVVFITCSGTGGALDFPKTKKDDAGDESHRQYYSGDDDQDWTCYLLYGVY
ncbi:hypothetical protein EDB85DRAFT_2223152 [Lactarius pseudohatsudake]|nr:hypothetical protein EDB85DRAFT_2223152 [Lactarius pseudohatsudake]